MKISDQLLQVSGLKKVISNNPYASWLAFYHNTESFICSIQIGMIIIIHFFVEKILLLLSYSFEKQYSGKKSVNNMDLKFLRFTVSNTYFQGHL